MASPDKILREISILSDLRRHATPASFGTMTHWKVDKGIDIVMKYWASHSLTLRKADTPDIPKLNIEFDVLWINFAVGCAPTP